MGLCVFRCVASATHFLFFEGESAIMKVKVRSIAAPYTAVPTKSLQAILYNDAHDKLRVKIGTTQLFAIMEELANRRKPSDYRCRTSEAAWDEFCNYYMPSECFDENHIRMIVTPHTLTPSPPQGKECLGNGTWPGYECQCCLLYTSPSPRD